MNSIDHYTLREQLSNFDGKEVAILEEMSSQHDFSYENLQSLLSLVESEEETIQIGASWLMLNSEGVSDFIGEEEKEQILGFLDSDMHWQVTLHFLQLIPKIQFTEEESKLYFPALEKLTKHSRPFIRAWSYGGLCHLGESDETIRSIIRSMLENGLLNEKGSVSARIRNAIKQSKWLRDNDEA